MAELPPPDSDDNKIEGYCRTEDVFAALEHYLNPKFLQRILETVPNHDVRSGCARSIGTNNLLTHPQLTDEPLSVSQTGASSDQSTFRDRSISSFTRARSSGPRRSPSAPESIQSSVPMWLGFVRPYQNYRSLPVRQRDTHGECSAPSSRQNTPAGAAGLADSTRDDATTQDKSTAEEPAHFSKNPTISPSASVFGPSGLSDTIDSSADESSAAI
jgi:hypothetical protein